MINKYIIVVFALIVLIALGAFLKDSESDTFYNSVDEAIESGLETENLSEENIISVIPNKKNHLVIFIKDEAIGLAIVENHKKGHRWVRNDPLFSFEGIGDYSRIDTEVNADGSHENMILMGEVHDQLIKSINAIEEDGINVEIWNKDSSKSSYFYYIYDINEESPTLDLKF